MTHPQIVSVVAKKYGVGPWWQQMVVVGYEQARGMRQVHERPDGFEISASRTMQVPASKAYRAWTDPRQRTRWLPRVKFEITKATPWRTLRIAWPGGSSRVDVTFTSKGRSKCAVQVSHGNLASANQAERLKRFWRAGLERLEDSLEA